jgi:hypothetical protein
MHDGLDAWEMQADGSYQSVRGQSPHGGHSAQTALMARYGLHSAHQDKE